MAELKLPTFDGHLNQSNDELGGTRYYATLEFHIQRHVAAPGDLGRTMSYNRSVSRTTWRG